jgi:hypothetical protein
MIAIITVIEIIVLMVLSSFDSDSQLSPEYMLKHLHSGELLESKQLPLLEQVSFWHTSILDSQKFP